MLDTEARRTAYDAAGTERRVFRGEQLTNKPKTKLLVDGGDPNETLRIKNLLGFVDGQTTNPSLIAKNPEIQRRLVSGQRLSEQEEKDAYKKIVQSISPHVGDAGVSIEVFADLDSREVVQGARRKQHLYAPEYGFVVTDRSMTYRTTKVRRENRNLYGTSLLIQPSRV